MSLDSFIVNIFFVICFSSVLCELKEGSECISEEDGMKGTCVNIHRCMQFVKHLRDKTRPQVCSYKVEVPVVCCTDCELVNDTNNILIDRFGLHYFKTGRKVHDKPIQYVIEEKYPCQMWGGVQRYLIDEMQCYGYTPTAILAISGGMDATRGEYPHMALLGYGEDQKSAEWLCGGSLISHRYVLTAGHCISSRATGPVKYIALGLLKRTDPIDKWQKYNIQKVIPHPDYKSPSKYNDIALLLSDKWIKFNHLVMPASLNAGEASETVAFATGWGGTGHRRGLADTMQTVVLSAYSEPECTAFFPQHRHLVNGYNSTTQMCYGDKDNIHDTCEGDSGGPIQVHSQLSSCMHTIIGVTSYGKPCGFAGGAGIYTRVQHYVPWIESIVWR